MSNKSVFLSEIVFSSSICCILNCRECVCVVYVTEKSSEVYLTIYTFDWLIYRWLIYYRLDHDAKKGSMTKRGFLYSMDPIGSYV